MTLTLDILLEAQRRLAQIPAVPEIRESIHAVQMVQARVYPKRKAKNASHLRRMNTTWKRRYGMRAEPGAFLMDLSLSGLGRGKVLFVHPELMEAARQAIGEATDDMMAYGAAAVMRLPPWDFRHQPIQYLGLTTFRWP
ncbi:MAG: hypothetical protein ACYDAE_24780 [Steroidobacteraceae bacterium]